jgi:endoglucanase
MNPRHIFARVALTAWIAGVPAIAFASGEPVKLATAARFDLTADAKVGAIEKGQVVEGNGSIDRMNWVPESDQVRGYTVNFPVSHLGWRVLKVRFVPAQSGTVTLALMGPYEASSSGGIIRQEVVWDQIKVTGTELGDGGFERPLGGASGWQSGGGVVVAQTPGAPAIEGSHVAQTWHNQTLFAALGVVGGRAVTIEVHARAVRIAGMQDMKPITSRTTPAHRAARQFLRGANLGNGLETPPGQDWGGHYTPQDLSIMRTQGFDHVRIPVGWHNYTGPAPEYRITQDIFDRADLLVNAGLRENLGVMINIHHFEDFTSHPQEQTARFLAIWRQVAAHYAKAPGLLVFELLNEPKDAATTEVMNPIYAAAIREIRKIDPGRTIVVGPGRWNSIGELPKLILPDDDQNLIVTVHNYDPFYFTHQGADWTGPETKVSGIIFPGPPPVPLVPDPKLNVDARVLNWIKAYNTEPAATNPCSPLAFQAPINQAKEWSEYYGRPIHVGEFGCYIKADPVSRANWYRAFRMAAEQANIGWAIWDWKAGFHYWNEQTGQPEPGMHEALFGTSRRRTE